MAIRITPGDISWRRDVTCDNCKAVWDLDIEDVQADYFEPTFYDKGIPKAYFTCPDCLADTILQNAPQTTISKLTKINDNKG